MPDFFDTTIGDQLVLQRGFDITKKQQKPGDVPVVSSGGISSYHNEAKVKGPGVVLGRKGTLGTVFFIEEDYWPHDTSLWVKDFKDNNPRFVYYFFKSITSTIKKMDVGAANPALNRNHVHPMEVRWPKRKFQNYIVEVLSKLDDKIELNRQTNQTLEQIAQAIFKSWFVDFEPVKAKIQAKQNGQDPERAAMCAISGKSLDELEQLSPETQQQLKTTAVLFPDALVESELGEMPEGWNVNTMEGLSTIVAMGPFGSNIKVSTFVDTGIPVVSGQHLKGIMLEDNKYNFITLEHADKLKKANVERGDVVFTHAGSIGQVACIPDKSRYERYVLSQRQFYMRPKQDLISPLFITYYFKSHIGQYVLLCNASQVGVPSISRPVSNLRKITAVVPSKNLSDEFHKLVNTFHNKISESNNEINILENIKNSLLPKLLSGALESNIDQAELVRTA